MSRGKRARHLALLATAAAVFLVASAGLALAITRNGGPGNDVLVGTNGPDTLNGRGGNDSIRGLGGDDRLRGGPGRDRVSGGAGNDFINTRDDRTRDFVSCGAGRRDRAVVGTNDVVDGKTLSGLINEANAAVGGVPGGAPVDQVANDLASLTSCENLRFSGRGSTTSSTGGPGGANYDFTQQSGDANYNLTQQTNSTP